MAHAYLHAGEHLYSAPRGSLHIFYVTHIDAHASLRCTAPSRNGGAPYGAFSLYIWDLGHRVHNYGTL